MKNIRSISIVLLLLICMVPVFGQFQEIMIEALPDMVGARVRVSTESDATFQGTLYSVTDEFILIQDRDGQILTIVKAVIIEVLLIDAGLDEKAYYQDSASNRLLVMPTGFPMEPGEFHIADQEIAAVTMSYGVNRNFSLWGGISLPGALVSARYIWSLGDRAALSVGSFAGISWMEFLGIIIPYTIFSVGEPEDNFTLGAGTAFTFDSDDFSLDAAILVLGRKWVLSDTTAIVTENWIIWGQITDYGVDYETSSRAWDFVPWMIVPGVAFRIAGEKFSWDIGVVLPTWVERSSGEYYLEGLGGRGTFVPVPLISLTYRID
ncbi:MAG: hypothetical protein JEY99_06760 [Spirochaetales bacterium]|nr:hypothetical protein [Spirochaetales bacterium]